MSGAVRVARLEELAAGQTTLVEVNGSRVVLVRVGDSVYACGEVCAHQGGPLSEGTAQRIAPGLPLARLAVRRPHRECVMPTRGGAVPSYPVRVEAGEVWVEVRLNGAADRAGRGVHRARLCQGARAGLRGGGGGGRRGRPPRRLPPHGRRALGHA